jgi:hypothetical protein
MTAPRVYRSTDAGAPVMNETPGTLINVLQAVLVDGYGTQPGAGWTAPYTGTLKRVFKQGSGSAGRYLRIDDSSTLGGGSYPFLTLACGYESMTGVDTGLAPFPSVSQGLLPGTPSILMPGLNWSRYYAVSGNRPWMIIANQKQFFFFHETYTNNYEDFHYFGDIAPVKNGDQFATMIIGCNSPSPVTDTPILMRVDASLKDTNYYRYLCRSYSQVGQSVLASMVADYSKHSGSRMGQPGLGLAYPHPLDGGLYLSPVFVGEPQNTSGIFRGTIPGMWAPLHPTPWTNGDLFYGSGVLAGRTFLGFKARDGSGAAFEISDTWYT